VYFGAALNGRNEVRGAPGSPAVGDPDGKAVELLRIQGNQVSFALKWQGISAPTAGHIHLGATGTNGAVEIPFFGSAVPGNLTAAVGKVTVGDVALLNSIKSNPAGFYANIHTAEFPGGAVRGQLNKLTKPVDLNSVLRGGPLAATLDGNQEVGGGDSDGRATAVLRARGSRVNYALHWSGINPPTDVHIHQGVTRTNGPVVVGLLAAPGGLPASFSGVAGTATGVDRHLADSINRHPADFYANIHTSDFLGGAVRGQLVRLRAGHAARFNASSFTANVVKGQQIYGCTTQSGGSHAFTQRNVRAVLHTGIRHSFVQNTTGPPQWISVDGSAVTGKLISKHANGAQNIAELDLDATSTGKQVGQLANVQEILRLNTVGGVAPAGSCNPNTHPISKVPYQADYLFLTR
jgi:hypothetical protein